MEENQNIYQKLSRIRKAVEVMKKDKKGYGYTYTKEESILAKITAYMDKLGLSLLPGIVPGTTVVQPYNYKKTKATAKGDIYEENVNEILVKADTTWTWVNNDNPDERIKVPWAMVGQQGDASQAFGSGLTYSSRYFLLKYFNIATSDDDPDEFRRKQKETEAEEDRLIAEKTVEVIHSLVTKRLEKSPDDRDEIMATVKKYVKSCNYYDISDSVTAAKLLQDLQNKFKEEE